MKIPICKWMMTGGTPVFGHLEICFPYVSICYLHRFCFPFFSEETNPHFAKVPRTRPWRSTPPSTGGSVPGGNSRDRAGRIMRRANKLYIYIVIYYHLFICNVTIYDNKYQNLDLRCDTIHVLIDDDL